MLYRFATVALLLLETLINPASAQHKKAAPKNIEAEVRKATRAVLAGGVPAIMVVAVWGGKNLCVVEGQDCKGVPATQATLFPLGTASRVIANMAFASLVQQRILDLDVQANDCIAPLVLRDRAGDPSHVSLRKILHGYGLPCYRNLLERKDLAAWSLEKAIADQGRAVAPADFGSELDYTIVQMAAERATRKPWAKIVKSTVADPLKLRRLVADARERISGSAALPHHKSDGEPPRIETRYYTHLLAEYGAWTTAADMSRLLLQLLDLSRDKTSPKKIEVPRLHCFNVNRPDDKDLRHLYLKSWSRGVSGRIEIYPQHRTAFAVFANMSPYEETRLGTVIVALQEQLLPRFPGWSYEGPALIGGDRWQPLPRIPRGEYVAQVLVRGEPCWVRVWVGESGEAEKLQVRDGPTLAIHPRHSGWGRRFIVEGGDLLRLRPDLRGDDQVNTELTLEMVQRQGRTELVGRLQSYSYYFQREYLVRFEPAPARLEPASKPTDPGKR